MDLSLLTRLRDLRRLELRFRVEGKQHYDDSNILQGPGFAWIQQSKNQKTTTRPAQGMSLPHSPPLSFIHSLPLRFAIGN